MLHQQHALSEDIAKSLKPRSWHRIGLPQPGSCFSFLRFAPNFIYESNEEAAPTEISTEITDVAIQCQTEWSPNHRLYCHRLFLRCSPGRACQQLEVLLQMLTSFSIRSWYGSYHWWFFQEFIFSSTTPPLRWRSRWRLWPCMAHLLFATQLIPPRVSVRDQILVTKRNEAVVSLFRCSLWTSSYRDMQFSLTNEYGHRFFLSWVFNTRRRSQEFDCILLHALWRSCYTNFSTTSKGVSCARERLAKDTWAGWLSVRSSVAVL